MYTGATRQKFQKFQKYKQRKLMYWINRWGNIISILYFFSYMSVYHVMILNELPLPILALYINVFIKSDNINVKQGGP